jgi:hypothetical protein
MLLHTNLCLARQHLTAITADLKDFTADSQVFVARLGCADLGNSLHEANRQGHQSHAGAGRSGGD